MSTFIEIHTITTLGAQNINRGQEGAPKTTTFGGTERQVVSSQSLKKAMRDYVRANSLAPVSIRTRLYLQKIASTIAEATGKSPEESWEIACDYLTRVNFLNKAPSYEGKVEEKDDEALEKSAQVKLAIAAFTETSLENIALEAIEVHEKVSNGEKPKKPDLQKRFKKITQEGVGLDVALFGTMVANDPALSVDAAAQIAYAISTNAFRREFDFYTAVDDLLETNGSAMMGDVEYGSSTIYRFGVVNVEALIKNLGIEANPERVVEYVQAFLESFIKSLPTGKQNSFAARVLPSFVNITIKDTQPLSLVSAFEKPVPTAEEAINAFKSRRETLNKMYDENPIYSADLEEGGDSLKSILGGVEDTVRRIISND